LNFIYYISKIASGYAIGYGYPLEIDNDCKIFSMFYLVGGCTAISTYIVNFAQGLVKKKQWYKLVLIEEKEANSQNIFKKLLYWTKENHDNLVFLYLLIAISIILGVWASYKLDMDAVTATYFALSAVTTIGEVAIPPSSNDVDFVAGLTCIYMYSFLLKYHQGFQITELHVS